MTLQTNVNLWNHLIFGKKTKNEAYKAKMYWLSQENKKLTPLLFKTIFFFLQTEFFSNDVDNNADDDDNNDNNANDDNDDDNNADDDDDDDNDSSDVDGGDD